ncbi:hypothetical protein C8R44DRAFT_120783 [Mycena epipterygia]|nr:hypothetical protein C8R44DRAFT_120783 [Mycena epipterygia]
MAPTLFSPPEVNPETGELFLRLASHDRIILTLPRTSDAAAIFDTMNDPEVFPWLGRQKMPCIENAENLVEGLLATIGEESWLPYLRLFSTVLLSGSKFLSLLSIFKSELHIYLAIPLRISSSRH